MTTAPRPSPRAVRLRAWQKRALDQLRAAASPDFLAVATPGAGKTTFALTAARLALAAREVRRVVVVVPTQHLKEQWAAAAERLDLAFEARWAPAAGLAQDWHGVVVTYQQVASSARALGSIAAGSFTVFDEVHHAADDRSWGDAVRLAFTGADRRLALSGTPFRSDAQAIPFVRYDPYGEAEADFEYGYGDALADRGVVRPVYFPRLDGEMEWSAPDGTLYQATFDDPLSRQLANQRLRTALSVEGEWLPAVLSQADERLRRLRASQPDAGGLVITIDQEHARAVASLLERRCGSRAVLATSDESLASERIARFAEGDTPWIVAVRMVSEGVDIPRLRVGVFATTTTTELYFRQAVGRFVRWVPGDGRQPAYVYLPDDVRLRTFAQQLAQQRRHILRRRERPEGEDAAEAPSPEDTAEEAGAEQLSLFAALSARPLGDPKLDSDETREGDGGVGGADGDRSSAAGPDDRLDGDWAQPPWEVELAPLPAAPDPSLEAPSGVEVVLQPLAGPAGAPARGSPSRGDRRRLRHHNAAVANELVHRTGWPHAKVNAELNRLAGVGGVAKATAPELERRLAAGRRWLDQLVRRPRR